MKNFKLAMAFAVAAGALVMHTAPAAAQTIGFKGGPTWSKVHETNGDNSGTNFLQKIGGGGFVRFGMAGLSLQVDALALTKGAKATDSGTDVSLKIDYVDVPVQLRLGGGSSITSPYILLGPSFGFKTSCNAEASFGGGSVSGNCADAGADVKSMDIGATGALGFEFRAGPGSILVEGRYTHGLANINNDGSGNKITNRMFAAMAGYSISLR